jgi:hypothetical protein
VFFSHLDIFSGPGELSCGSSVFLALGLGVLFTLNGPGELNCGSSVFHALGLGVLFTLTGPGEFRCGSSVSLGLLVWDF